MLCLKSINLWFLPPHNTYSDLSVSFQLKLGENDITASKLNLYATFLVDYSSPYNPPQRVSTIDLKVSEKWKSNTVQLILRLI